MSRLLNYPATVTLVPDPVYRHRPYRIVWRDRFGHKHTVVAAAVQDQWKYAELDYATVRLQEFRWWRLVLDAGGRITIYENLAKPAGDEGRWVINRVDD